MTNCVSPPELDDKQLVAYLDGAADDATVSHLKTCAYCREKAEALDRLQKHLTARLYRITCPSSIELGEYHLRLLPASRMLVIAQHMRECPHCTREVAQLESFLHELAPAEDRLPGVAKVLVAKLMSGQAVPALRGEGKGPLTFAAEGIVIVLDIQPDQEGQRAILGQVAADQQDDWTGALVELWKDSLLHFSSTIDDLGAFRCEGVLPGSHELRMTPQNGSVVVISNFEVPT